jgi:hypothetical protein
MKCRSRFGVAGCLAGSRCPERGDASLYVPRDSPLGPYYEATDRKHFSGGADVPGSKFSDPRLKRVEDVVQLLLDDGRDLFTDDDRGVFFVQDNVPEEAFLDQYRYLKVHTGGTLGAVKASSLDDDTVLDVVRTKPGAHCSLVVTVDEQPLTDSSVVIVGDHNDSGLPFIVTAFPGVPTKPVGDDRVDALEGSSTTVGDVKQLLQVNDFWINTRS